MYVGQTRSAKLIAELEQFGFGECTNRGEFPPRRKPWFADNGAFKDWKAGKVFDEPAFLLHLQLLDEQAPDFVVVPDIVAGGEESLRFSLKWLPVVHQHCSAPAYLAVQDGMTTQRIGCVVDQFQGLFVGGTKTWKAQTTEQWIWFAHDHGMPCHLGRCGTAKWVRAAKRWGVDSIDSCLPLWSKDNLRVFVEALADEKQTELFK